MTTVGTMYYFLFEIFGRIINAYKEVDYKEILLLKEFFIQSLYCINKNYIQNDFLHCLMMEENLLLFSIENKPLFNQMYSYIFLNKLQFFVFKVVFVLN